MVSFGGGGGGTAGYLTGEKDAEGRQRESVDVLVGDSFEVQEVGDSLDFAHRSTTGVIAWAPEDDPTDGQIREVLQEFEKTAWAGLEPERYAWSAVQHRDGKGGVHVHVYTARGAGTTGERPPEGPHRVPDGAHRERECHRPRHDGHRLAGRGPGGDSPGQELHHRPGSKPRRPMEAEREHL